MPRHEAAPQRLSTSGATNGPQVTCTQNSVGHPAWPTLCVVDETLEAQLKAASARRRRLMRQLDEARSVERALLFDALQAGGRQVEIVAITGYTREHVRRLSDAEADHRGVPRPGARIDS